jgi:hypothetical protein
VCAPLLSGGGEFKTKTMTLEDKIRNALIEFVKEVKSKKVEQQPRELHIMYTYKGEFHQAFKCWTFAHAEEVLTRLGATYWEIG